MTGKTINIHGKEYMPVSERVRMAHDELKELSITTEGVAASDVIVIKATVTTPKGTFTGLSAANPAKAIEKMSPYEVAETSAVGRALGFAGYGIVEGIATADEVIKATDSVTVSNFDPKKSTITASTNWQDKPASLKQREAICKISELTDKKLGFDDTKGWTAGQASEYISKNGSGGYKKAVETPDEAPLPPFMGDS